MATWKWVLLGVLVLGTVASRGVSGIILLLVAGIPSAGSLSVHFTSSG